MLSYQFTKKYVFPHWPWYLVGFLTLGITTLITLEIPQIAKTIVNALSGESFNHEEYVNLTYLIIGLGLLQIIIRTLSRITIFWPGRKLEAFLRTDLFKKLLTLPQNFYDQQGVGDLNSRISNDTGHIRVFYAFGILQLANLVFLSIFIVSKMLSVNVSLTLVCLVPLLILIAMTKLLMPKMHEYSKVLQDQIGTMTNRVTEAFVNIHTIHANSAYNSFYQKLAAINSDVYSSNIKLVRIRTILFPLIPSFASVSQVIVLYYGGLLVIKNLLTVGDILAFNFYIGLLSFPLMSIGIILSIYQRTKVAIARIDLIEKAPQEANYSQEKDFLGAKQSTNKTICGSLHVQNLSFAYPAQANNFVLEDIKFSLAPGERLGIFGPIGSGKTTLFNLCSLIYLPPKNTLYYNEQDLTLLNPDLLRKDVVHVQQKPHLFSDSIMNNLCFGISPRPSLEEAQQACQKADILRDIEQLPLQWDTEVGEQGFKLSGGQKQRLALARAFMRHPKILMLDDVLSAVDHQTEATILKSIYQTGCSLMISSHRSSVLAACDRVLILEQGKIIQSGTFNELREFFEALEVKNLSPESENDNGAVT